MINVAVIGTGAISSRHLQAYLTFAQECTIKRVADIDLAKAEKSISENQLDAMASDDYKTIIEDRSIDLVSICTPPSTHAEIAIACLEAGKHVLVEKPMAASLEDCDKMIAAAQENGRLLSVVAQNRFQSSWMKLKKLLDEQAAGRVLHAQINSYWWRGLSYYDLWWRGTWESEGGGCTLNHAVHHIDALQWMMGLPTEVHAMMSNVAHQNAEVEDISMALLRFESGALGQITSSVVHHGQEQQLVFQCERGKLSAPWDLYGSIAKENGFPQRDAQLESEIQEAYDSQDEVSYEGHTGQIENVLSAIAGQSELLVTGEEGRRTLELITAIYASASRGIRVDLPLDSDDPFYTKRGLLESVPHFYEKSASVKDFEANEITTKGNY
ncbi:Gfo/Idh/MocA family protein [Alicyclobacillus sp. SO9]|uniref:Gfo/Idh/MocA family protein n=1 Tax=Alicyclobacillus sp. SO9 TaxID=2665646 RepID=UPI0018E7DD0E|nr:Gfo/Idh/MocA family oxidoreductase [Alicyclobacillus sp. SO9]QQE77910.1 Gfo/Idh/MocA family oxidoreductase [Alicyclobacillus sp. SO9]